VIETQRCLCCNGTGTVPVDVGIGNWNTNDCPECDGRGTVDVDCGGPPDEIEQAAELRDAFQADGKEAKP
jgi:DnaJ-class molecular chaperone